MTAKRAALFVWESGPQMIQLALAIHAAGLAMILIEPIDTFGSAPGYQWMAARATENHWALIAFAISLLGILSVCVVNTHLRAASAFLCSVFTGAIAYGYYISNPDGTGWWTYAVLTMLSYWLLWQRVWRP